MHRTRPPRRSCPIASLALILAIAPACAATAGHKAPCAASPQGTAGANTVFRPVYGAAPTRPLFLSGYAGVNYAAGAPRARALADGLRRPSGPPVRVPLRQACLGPVGASSRGIAYFKVESRLDGPPVSRLQSRPGGSSSAGLTLAIAGTRRKDGPRDGLGRVADRHRRRGQDRPRAAPAGLPGLARRPDRRRLQPAPRVVGPGRPRVQHPQGLRQLGKPDRRRRSRCRRHRRLAQHALPGHPGRLRRPQARPDPGAHGDERPRGPAHARPLAGVPLPDGDDRPQPLRPDRRRLHALA